MPTSHTLFRAANLVIPLPNTLVAHPHNRCYTYVQQNYMTQHLIASSNAFHLERGGDLLFVVKSPDDSRKSFD